MPRIELVARRLLQRRRLRRKQSIRVQIIRSRLRALQRPFFFIAPMSADKDAPLRRFVRVASAHHEDAHRRVLLDTVIDALQPMLVPAKGILVEGYGGFRPKLRLPGVAAPPTT